MFEKLEALQRKLSDRVALEDEYGEISRVAGVDATYINSTAIAAAVIVDFKTLKPLEEAVAVKKVKVKYVPGFFAFRELPALIKVLKKLALGYDLVLVNGHGIAHPRFFGIASHLGVVLEKPTLGVARRLLCGSVKGNEIIYQGRKVGYVLYGKRKLYISPGHRISPEKALEIVKRLTVKALPEPLRLAHSLAKAEKTGLKKIL